MSKRTDYFGHENEYYFEDSYIERITTLNRKLTIQMILAMTVDHPEYRSPKPDERHCYCRVKLVFPSLVNATWSDLFINVSIDPDGSADIGSPHALKSDSKSNNTVFLFFCDVGSAIIESDPPYLEFED